MALVVGFSALVSAPVLARYEDRISHHTPFGIVLLAQFALPSEIPGYLLGVVRYPFARYLAALGIVEVIYGVATVYLGIGVVERRVAPVMAAAAALVLVSTWAVYTLGRRLARERGEGTVPLLRSPHAAPRTAPAGGARSSRGQPR
jgi:uncharacterized membrane protein YdjX (TVP38/TMEM64 family)